MVHYQREVAKATTAQVVIMQKQVEVAQKRCADGKAATGSERTSRDGGNVCRNGWVFRIWREKKYLL
ncbi:hypothetical protein JG687_00007460 [Phytophthora cactorum]|uniref:Uncharacterized protein n=1 Tax=Phytophthora cactorum TaxID=29920 RepID=A0A8T1UJN2_9STRA|nr:hypothetical protein JG687_00007460 [Phytophthora cactorum]